MRADYTPSVAFLRIAVRNVVRNRRRSLITGVAIFVGIGVLVGVRGLVNGFQLAISTNVAEGKLGGLAVHHPHYLASGEMAPLNLTLPADPAFLARLTAVPGVRAATPRVGFNGMVSVGETTAPAMVTGVDPVREAMVLPRAADAIVAGRVISGPGEAVLGSELARGLGAGLGTTVIFLASDKDGVLNAVEARVVGLLAYKVPGDKRIAQLALPDADQLLRLEGRVTQVALRVDHPGNARALREVKARVAAAVGKDGVVHSWVELASWIQNILAFQEVMFSIIGFVFIAVVLTGITNTMLMSVLERVREIGTLMALGVRRRRIVALFLTEAAALGLVGGVAGALAGSAVTLWLHHRGIDLPPPGVAVSNIIRPTVGLGYNLFAVALAVVGAAASGVYPALKASRMRPVEALAHA
jgi:putative ABC transport system permease protein